jgi:hypothetical protein
MPTLPSSGRWPALPPKFVEAVRVCDGLADMVRDVTGDILVILRVIQGAVRQSKEQFRMVGLSQSSRI